MSERNKMVPSIEIQGLERTVRPVEGKKINYHFRFAVSLAEI